LDFDTVHHRVWFFGIQASLIGAAYEGELIGMWSAMFPPWVFAALMISLLVSTLSTRRFGAIVRGTVGG
jgi:hypothetical protein